MVMHYDLYGCRLEDLDSVRTKVERALDVKLRAHNSDYQGGDYYRFDSSSTGESFVLKRNFDPVEGEWFEEKFKEYPILLYVERTHRAREIEKRLEMNGSFFALLRRKTT